MSTEPPSVAQPPPSHEKVVAMNEALILGSLRQHELTEAAETLNEQLRSEIRQRLLAEEALRESEERFRSLFASVPMAVFACDRDAVIQHYNSHSVELWGREPACGGERLCGSVRLWLPDGTQLPHERSPIVEVLSTGVAANNVEFSIERPDGSLVPVLANFAALKNGDGEITGAIASFVDLTERRKIEQHAIRAQRLESIGRLASGIAHDLNNALGPILMSADLLKLQTTDPDSRELLAIIEASGQRGAAMVRQVLGFARGVEGKRAEVNIPELVREMEKIVNETFLRQVQVHVRIRPDVWTVVGDNTQLHQVLLNLCLNARDAMPNGGALVISAENRVVTPTFAERSHNLKARPGTYVLLQVEDNGTGMAPEVLEHIYDPFFTTKEFGKGSGLGLSTTLAIVESHSGFLHVASEPGKGTIFQIFLPALAQTASTSPPPPDPEMPRGRGELLLIVEDEAPMRDIQRRSLEASGYRVIVACDGAEAVSIYTQLGPKIAAVITDMTMPVMEGPEMIRILLGIDPHQRIIGVSGLVATTYAPQLVALGVRHVLPKPYRTAELLKMVRKVLDEPRPSTGTDPDHETWF